MVNSLRSLFLIISLFTILLMLSKSTSARLHPRRNNTSPSSSPPPSSSPSSSSSSLGDGNKKFCLSWRLGVEANNVVAWGTVPRECQKEVESYMIDGQYDEDLDLVMQQISTFLNSIPLSSDSLDAWVLDIDETCLSNLYYYKTKRFGCDPYDPVGFRAWASKGGSPAISPVLQLFNKLLDKGFKVFLVSGRDQETLGQATINNLHNQGFIGYQRLILRSVEYKGQSAVRYKSDIRQKLEKEGYRIWGNVGDQWSDIRGDSTGNRTFKLPNPMYFVP
ncbi:acid phosphatase 1-like [Neltuma alba]|uniref:acid phosphatase 1-like n=1 Tax=Neltuma alba TaxID=207710 RepID=UPI0010A356BE|nr:acid phosphatase 1-like [Prosopis alba]XP_028806376.1 acid phosphatase 1-like [Prosopis alba]